MKKPLVVVVDNDRDHLKMMAIILAYHGCVTCCCQTCQEAYGAISRKQPHLVILDLRMEHETEGWQLLELLRDDSSTAHIPVIMCSADVEFLQSNEQLLRERCCAIIEKPFQIDDLITKVDDAITLTQ